jgi:hypothetical protein
LLGAETRTKSRNVTAVADEPDKKSENFPRMPTLSHHSGAMNQSFTVSPVSSPNSDRRRDPRIPLRRFANKYIEGMPYMVEILDATPDGFGIRTFNEPKSDRETFALELWVDSDHLQDQGTRIFAWAKKVRTSQEGDGEKREAYKILAADPLDRARLRKFLRTLAA